MPSSLQTARIRINALYRYNTGYVAHSGSSRTPTGAISLPSSLIGSQFGGCTGVPGNGNRVTLASGGGTALSDYRCYNASKDAFNYQAVGNYDLTPSERTGLFALGNYKLTDNIEAYGEFYHNKTVSRQQQAPVPLDAQADGIFIPANGSQESVLVWPSVSTRLPVRRRVSSKPG